MDTDNVQRFLTAGAILGWTVFLIGLAGELLGWWNATGEFLMTIGAVTAVPLSAANAIWGATRRQVNGIVSVVTENNQVLHHHTGFFVSMDRKLDSLDKLEDLDVIQVELDKQTGVLEQQLVVLRELAGH